MDLLKYVNIKHGTDSVPRFSSGNTLPLTALPHALAAFAPQTCSTKSSWFYHPKDKSLEGIRLTHQPSPWVADFSHFCFMPQANGFFESPDARWSGFRNNEAELFPHYLKVKFLRYGAELKLAPTDSGAVMQLAFDDTIELPRFAVLPFDFISETHADLSLKTICGFTTSLTNSPYHDNFKIWFAFSFSCGISDPITSQDKSHKMSVALGAKNVTVRLATSYVSQEQALLNLKRETAGKSFDDIKQAAENEWEGLLGKIRIQADEERKKTFYSCMYRAFLYPTKFYETDKSGNAVHVVPETGEIKKGVMYTNNGFWDTFRTVYPFYSIVIPEKLKEILTGYLNFYDDTGYLPRWPSAGEFGCMPGTLIEAVFADAAVKGLMDDTMLKRALAAVLKNAEVQSQDTKQGRKRVREYSEMGYVPFDLCHESVNETLDCAYGDYCIGVIAETAGQKQLADKFYLRSKNYNNIFDHKEGFFRGKDSSGNFRNEKFNPVAWGRDYTEGSVWQNGLAVQHDIEGLSALYGGVNGFHKKLDELFATPPFYAVGGYGCEIHEITEMAAVDFGQCAISNQPSFHIPYLYSATGDLAKTEYWVDKLVNEAFSSADDGYPGDEDNGTMACWYIFSCLGFYPVSPGNDYYIKGKRCVDSAVITLPNGKKTDISTLISDDRNRIYHRDIIKDLKK